MNPAFSVVIFTTIAGAAQGLVVSLALALLAGLQMQPGFVGAALILAEVMLLIGLAALSPTSAAPSARGARC